MKTTSVKNTVGKMVYGGVLFSVGLLAGIGFFLSIFFLILLTLDLYSGYLPFVRAADKITAIWISFAICTVPILLINRLKYLPSGDSWRKMSRAVSLAISTLGYIIGAVSIAWFIMAAIPQLSKQSAGDTKNTFSCIVGNLN